MGQSVSRLHREEYEYSTHALSKLCAFSSSCNIIESICQLQIFLDETEEENLDFNIDFSL